MRACRILLFATSLVAAFATHDAATAGDSPRAIDDLENDLVADDQAVRAKAAAELTDRFPDGAVAVPMLVDLLDDELPDVVAAAARAIDSMAVAGVSVLATWKFREIPDAGTVFIVDDRKYDAWSDDDADVAGLRRRFAPDSLQPWRLRLMRESPFGRREFVAATLAMQGAGALVERRLAPPPHPGRAANVTTALALFADARRATLGARLLEWLRSDDPRVLEALVGAVAPESGEPRSRNGACRVLVALGPRAAGAGPALSNVLVSLDAKDPGLDDCARALVSVAKDADVLAVLERCPRLTGDAVARELAAEKRATAKVVPRLVEAIKDRRTDRLNALWALSVCGPDAAAAIPALKEKVLERRSVDYAEVLLAVSPTDADALGLLEATASSTPTSRTADGRRAQAVFALAAHAPITSELVERLRREIAAPPPTPRADRSGVVFVDDRSFRVDRVVDGLGRCGPSAAPAVPDLVRLLGETSKQSLKVETACDASSLRRRLARALGRIGPDAAPAVPELEALTKSADETIRVPAAQALRRIRAKK